MCDNSRANSHHPARAVPNSAPAAANSLATDDLAIASGFPE
jgi:hypothetical protein